MYLKELKSKLVKVQDIVKTATGGSCCGGKLGNILTGLSRLAIDRILGDTPSESESLRLATCNSCNSRTWLSISEWTSGVSGETLPIDHDHTDDKYLWCSLCKCCIEAKIRVPDEHCPLCKWVGDPLPPTTPFIDPHPLLGKEVLYNSDRRPVDLVNTYKGKSLFLIASGPSFNTVDRNLLKQPGIVTMTLNNAGHYFRSNLWISGDSPQRFMNSIWEDPTVAKFVDLGFMSSNYWSQDKKSPAGKVRQCPNVFGFKKTSECNVDTWLDNPLFDWAGEPKNRRSVILLALKLAYVLGFSKVYLLGVDFCMSESEKYWFDQDRAKGAIRSNNSLYGVLRKHLKTLRPKFEEKGFYVYNCNPTSHLDVFPHVPLETALQSSVISLASSTLGAYSNPISDFPTIVSYATRGTPYELELRKLVGDIQKIGIRADTLLIDSKGQWFDNVEHQPTFIRDMLEKHNKPLLYLDSDIRIKDFSMHIKDLQCDLAVYQYPDKTFCPSVILMKNVRVAKSFMEAWKKIIKDIPDRVQSLTKVMSLLSKDIVVSTLGPRHCYNVHEDRKDPVIDPLFVHEQVSRRYRTSIDSKCTRISPRDITVLMSTSGIDPARLSVAIGSLITSSVKIGHIVVLSTHPKLLKLDQEYDNIEIVSADTYKSHSLMMVDMIKKVHTKYWCVIDSDDWIFPDHISNLIDGVNYANMSADTPAAAYVPRYYEMKGGEVVGINRSGKDLWNTYLFPALPADYLENVLYREHCERDARSIAVPILHMFRHNAYAIDKDPTYIKYLDGMRLSDKTNMRDRYLEISEIASHRDLPIISPSFIDYRVACETYRSTLAGKDAVDRDIRVVKLL